MNKMKEKGRKNERTKEERGLNLITQTKRKGEILGRVAEQEEEEEKLTGILLLLPTPTA